MFSQEPLTNSRLASRFVLSAAIGLFGVSSAFCRPFVACAAHSQIDEVCSMCVSPINLWSWSLKPDGKHDIHCCPPPSAPFAPPTYSVPCGKCPPCLAAKRQDWIRRIQCETWLHSKNGFITLTYNDDHLPADGLASKVHVQQFLKRFRNAPRDYGVSFDNLKYFIVSEYGCKHHRPHYHGILFGVDFRHPAFLPRFACLDSAGHPLYTSGILERCWSHGFVTFDDVTPASVAYVTKYITKASADGFRLFSRGLGKGFFFDSDSLLTPCGLNAIKTGFLAYPSRNGAFRGSIPKNIYRYLSLYYPMFSEDLKKSRREFALAKPIDSRPLADWSESVNIRNRQELQKRKLDNET